MTVYTPLYYDRFSCRKGDCEHTCCRGWEIDIDDETYERYLSLPGKEGDRIRKGISTEGGAHFILDEEERCPMLDDEGLCRIISAFGPEMLCDICDMHPRFYSEFDTFSELGLGIACEEAAHLLLTAEDGDLLMHISGERASFSDNEKYYLSLREKTLKTVLDKNASFSEKSSVIGRMAGAAYETRDDGFFLEMLRGIERMDPIWDSFLNRLEGGSTAEIVPSEPDERVLSNLLWYLIMRHLPKAFCDGDYSGWIRFCLFCAESLRRILRRSDPSETEDIARMFSAEVEYSEENTYLLHDMLTVLTQ